VLRWYRKVGIIGVWGIGRRVSILGELIARYQGIVVMLGHLAI
jgi:hypothetical protein